MTIVAPDHPGLLAELADLLAAEADLVGLYDVFTHPQARGQGLARRRRGVGPPVDQHGLEAHEPEAILHQCRLDLLDPLPVRLLQPQDGAGVFVIDQAIDHFADGDVGSWQELVALRGDAAATAATAMAFKVFYQKQPGSTPKTYSLDHNANSYLYDPQGRLRLYVRYGEEPAKIAADIRLLLDGK